MNELQKLEAALRAEIPTDLWEAVDQHKDEYPTFLLIDGVPTACNNLVASFYLSMHRDCNQVDLTEVGRCEVSTVLLLCGHGRSRQKPRFETMATLPNGEQQFRHYDTLEQARQGHQRMVERYRRWQNLAGD